jgi:hypothetical protein
MGSGHCMPVLEMSTTAYAPKCGCNGATYWNGSVAIAANEPIRHQDAACATGEDLPCTTAANACSQLTNGYCNLGAPLGSPCVTTLTGTCWVLPSSCVGTPGAGVACATTTCKTACALIQAQMPWVQMNCTPM